MAAHKEQMEKLKRMEEALSSQPSAVSENLFTAKDATDAKENRGLPRMDADERGSEGKNLPVIHTENTDLRAGEQTLPGINTDETDKDREPGRILPQSLGAEVYANRGPIVETHANLG
jgi:hypothetical protein